MRYNNVVLFHFKKNLLMVPPTVILYQCYNCLQGQVVWKLVTDRQNLPLFSHPAALLEYKYNNVQLSLIWPKIYLVYWIHNVFINRMWAIVRWFWVIYTMNFYPCKWTLFIRCVIRKKKYNIHITCSSLHVHQGFQFLNLVTASFVLFCYSVLLINETN